ncbi:MAG: hypothetical protein K6V36_13900 [Anaerolineae bacterium]|nr:hypothetical protein [Anaerolineae bacterium]
MALVAESGGGYSYPHFQVEISSLADFLSFIEHELGGSLDAGIDRVKLDAVDSYGLAASLAGPMIGASRRNYLLAQQFPIENLVRYMFTGVAMLEVIEYLMKMYKTTEEMAALTTADVQGFLSAAYEQKRTALAAHRTSRADEGTDASDQGA